MVSGHVPLTLCKTPASNLLRDMRIFHHADKRRRHSLRYELDMQIVELKLKQASAVLGVEPKELQNLA